MQINLYIYIYITQMNWNQWKKEINEHKWNSKNCLERDLNPRPRLSSVDVLTTTPPRQPR